MAIAQSSDSEAFERASRTTATCSAKYAHSRPLHILNRSYFSDKWNFLDVTTVVFVFIAFVFRIVELESGNAYSLFVAQLFLATAAPLLLSRVLFLTQIGSPLGPMTQVLQIKRKGTYLDCGGGQHRLLHARCRVTSRPSS